MFLAGARAPLRPGWWRRTTRLPNGSSMSASVSPHCGAGAGTSAATGRAGAAIASRCLGRDAGRSRLCAGNGQGEAELRAFAGLAVRSRCCRRPARSMRLATARPRPAPCSLAGIGGIAGREGLEQKMRHFRRHAMAGVGDGEAHKALAVSSRSASRRMSTSPRSVNLRALSASLSSAWRTRRGSAATRGRSGAAVRVRRRRFSQARGCEQPRHGARGLHGIAILVFQLARHRRGSAR